MSAHCCKGDCVHPLVLPMEPTEGRHLKHPSQTALHQLGCNQHRSGSGDRQILEQKETWKHTV